MLQDTPRSTGFLPLLSPSALGRLPAWSPSALGRPPARSPSALPLAHSSAHPHPASVLSVLQPSPPSGGCLHLQ